jgi:integrase
MPRKAKELSALEVGRLKEPGRHSVGVVDGLALQVGDQGQRSWVLRITVAGGKRREMGLGAYPSVTLATAREKARAYRETVAEGDDPVQARQTAVKVAAQERRKQRTFDEVATEYIENHSGEWKSAKHRQQWENTLATYAKPIIGSTLVQEVDTPEVLKILQPIWNTKAETARRVRNRLELVLDAAMAAGYRTPGLNPARWRGHLDKLLSKKRTGGIQHHPSVRVPDLGEFYRRLREQPGMGALALQFVLLTAARSGEVRGATWDEIDLERALWVIPAERMKADREHRTPLSPQAIDLLRRLPQGEADDLVFPGAKKGRPLSDMSLSAVMRRMRMEEVPHGLRASFKTWATNFTEHAYAAVEMALAHTLDDKLERAYQRGDLFDKRVHLMTEWATFLEAEAAKPIKARPTSAQVEAVAL